MPNVVMVSNVSLKASFYKYYNNETIKKTYAANKTIFLLSY